MMGEWRRVCGLIHAAWTAGARTTGEEKKGEKKGGPIPSLPRPLPATARDPDAPHPNTRNSKKKLNTKILRHSHNQFLQSQGSDKRGEPSDTTFSQYQGFAPSPDQVVSPHVPPPRWQAALGHGSLTFL